MTRKILIVIVFFLAIFSITFAQNSNKSPQSPYTPLEQLPVQDGTRITIPDKDTPINLEQYIPNMVKLAVGIAAALSVVYIIIGGFEYITSDALFKKQGGKEKIKNAVGGLLLALGAFVILNTINPRLAKVELDIRPATTTSTATGAPGITGQSGSVTPGRCIVDREGNAVACTCTDCINNPGALPFKGGVNTALNATLFNKLVLTKNSLSRYDPPVNWYITEAWPNKNPHTSGCHLRGTCVDLNVIPGYISGTTPSQNMVNSINRMYSNLRGYGLNVIFEAKSADIQRLRSAGVTGDFMRPTDNNPIYMYNTAPSFHVSL